MNESKEKATNDPESRLSMKSFKMQLCAAFCIFFYFPLLSLQYLILVELKVHHKINDWLSVTWSSLDLNNDEDNPSSERFFFFFQWPSEFSNSLQWVGSFVFSSATRQKKEKKKHLRQLLYDKKKQTKKKHYVVNLNSIICSVASTCIDYWQPEVKGPGLSSGGQEVGRANWRTGWLGGAGGKEGEGVLQVTVQVKRQILSAVWRKALEVPTVQRERSSYVWNTSSPGSKKNVWGEVRVAAAGRQEKDERN